jgi:bifunctional enzyme CysN/CysC
MAHKHLQELENDPTIVALRSKKAALDVLQITSAAERPLRLPIDTVQEGRIAGTIASGSLRSGDSVRIQPSGRTARVARILDGGRELDRAETAQRVALELYEPVEVGVGELVASADRPAGVADQFEATIVWRSAEPLLRGRSYRLEMGAASASATIAPLKYRINVDSLEHAAAAKLEAGEIGVCGLQLDRPIAFDSYRENPATGGFILSDPVSGARVGLGMLHFALRRAQNVHWQAVDVNKPARSALKGQRPCVLWYTGLSGAGKSSIANLVDKKLHAMKRHTYLLDGDNVRHGLNKDLGFTAADRVENIRRIAEVAKLMVDAGLIVGTAFISPFRAERQMARSLLSPDEFIEIFVDTPLSVAEARDPKGLYKKARRGELKNFTGIDSPYEAPENPELRIDTTLTTPEAAADVVVSYLAARGAIETFGRSPD